MARLCSSLGWGVGLKHPWQVGASKSICGCKRGEQDCMALSAVALVRPWRTLCCAQLQQQRRAGLFLAAVTLLVEFQSPYFFVLILSVRAGLGPMYQGFLCAGLCQLQLGVCLRHTPPAFLWSVCLSVLRPVPPQATPARRHVCALWVLTEGLLQCTAGTIGSYIYVLATWLCWL
jgi:hypothetical protein